ncbi:hypothetical protein [Bacillus velezensis]
MDDKINVLNNSYVRLTNVMGSDLSVVNSARVSYDKESTAHKREESAIEEDFSRLLHGLKKGYNKQQ